MCRCEWHCQSQVTQIFDQKFTSSLHIDGCKIMSRNFGLELHYIVWMSCTMETHQDRGRPYNMEKWRKKNYNSRDHNTNTNAHLHTHTMIMATKWRYSVDLKFQDNFSVWIYRFNLYSYVCMSMIFFEKVCSITSLPRYLNYDIPLTE